MEIVNSNELRILNIFMTYGEISDEVTRLVASKDSTYGYTVVKKMKEKNLLTECDRKVDIKKNNRTKRAKRSKNKMKAKDVKTSEHSIEPVRPNHYNYKALHINPKIKRTLFLGEDIEERKPNTSSLESEMKRSDTVLMCCLAGTVGYEKYSDKEQTYYRLDNMEEGYSNINPFAKDTSMFDLELFRQVMNKYSIVIPYNEIRNKFCEITGDQNHFNFSSAVGFLAGKYNPYLLYHANHGYVSARGKSERRIAEGIFQYMAMQGIYHLTGMRIKVGRGIIFVRNKNDFKRLIFNTYHCDRVRFSCFEFMHIVVENGKGVAHLSMIINYPDITQSIIQKFASVGQISHNPNIYYAKYFPLIDQLGRMIYYGIDMNYNTLSEVYYVYKHGEVEFVILCLEWQEEYYRSIFGEDMPIATIKEDAVINYLESLNEYPIIQI